MAHLRAAESPERRGFLRRRTRAEDRALTRDTLPDVMFATTAAGLAALIKSEMALWGPIIRKAGIKGE